MVFGLLLFSSDVPSWSSWLLVTAFDLAEYHVLRGRDALGIVSFLLADVSVGTVQSSPNTTKLQSSSASK